MTEDEAAFQHVVKEMSLEEHYNGRDIAMMRAVFLAGVVRGVTIRDEMQEAYRKQSENAASRIGMV